MMHHADLDYDLTTGLRLVTPDMHRVHHSVIIRETNSNFGFNLSCWDRLFGTYKDQPEMGHTDKRLSHASTDSGILILA